MSETRMWWDFSDDPIDDDEEESPVLPDFIKSLYRDYQATIPPMAKRKFERSMRGRDYSYENAFSGSALEFLDFSSSKLYGADFTRARLAGTNFSGALIAYGEFVLAHAPKAKCEL